MRSRTAQWFEVKVKYDKPQEDGTLKSSTDLCVVDAISFTDAEACATKEMSVYSCGDFSIIDIKKTTYHEIFFSDMGNDDCWFKAKLQFITFNEKKEKEERSNVYYLVQAHTLPQAIGYIQEVMDKTMIEYVIASVSDTKIFSVFEHNNAEEKVVKEGDKPEYEVQSEEQSNTQNP